MVLCVPASPGIWQSCASIILLAGRSVSTHCKLVFQHSELLLLCVSTYRKISDLIYTKFQPETHGPGVSPFECKRVDLKGKRKEVFPRRKERPRSWVWWERAAWKLDTAERNKSWDFFFFRETYFLFLFFLTWNTGLACVVQDVLKLLDQSNPSASDFKAAGTTLAG